MTESDGCSGGMSVLWRKVLGSPPPWETCCFKHDEAYAVGGTKHQRLKADLKLAGCVVANGHPFWAAAMFAAVRLFGGPHWPLSWRWGFKCAARGYVPEVSK